MAKKRGNEVAADKEFYMKGVTSENSKGDKKKSKKKDKKKEVAKLVAETIAEERIEFETGAKRGTAPPVRYDLISPVFLRRLAETCHEGAEKYDPGNYLKGIPCSNLLNHAITHIEQWKAGDTSEDHLAHATWNLMAIMHFEEENPEMLDEELIYTSREA